MEKKIVKNKTNKKTNQQGFSMLEVVLSVFVLTTGIVGSMGLLVSSMRHSMDSRDTIIATELAQEGIELVRNIRDNDIANGRDGVTGISNGNNCVVDYSPIGISCSGSPSYVLYYNSGFYNSTGVATDATKFRRRIQSTGGAGPILGITTIVTWGAMAPVINPTTATCNLGNKCTFVISSLVGK